MRKSVKRMLAVAAAAALSAGVLSLGACTDTPITASGMPSGYENVASNGGFVVSVGDSYYFINGKEDYTADNSYGTPVKGSLMRVKKTELGDNKAETVIPSLMVAGDYTAGLFVYGDRVYYATPTNSRNTSGEIENSYLDFKSAKLDGSDIRDVLRLESNTTVYRYVQPEKGGTVYLLYVEGSSSYTLHSYNLDTKTDTVLFEDATSYELDARDVTNPVVYYTMSVTADLGSDAALAQPYNQIYRVSAETTEVPAGYAYGEEDYWDMDWLKENGDGEIPYTNLGTLVLDGRGSAQDKSDFNHTSLENTALRAPLGYTYSLRSYQEGALYYTLTEVTGNEIANLYYLPETLLTDSWESAESADAGTKKAELVASKYILDTKATDAASTYFFTKEGKHAFFYAATENLFYAEMDGAGNIASELCIAKGIGTPTILSVDMTSSDKYEYVYFTHTNGSGTSVERAVFNGTEENYRNLTYTDDAGEHDNTPFVSRKVLDLQHATSWYPYELIDGLVFYADAESIGGTSYNYISVFDLNGENGIMDNKELKEVNDRYDSVVNASDKEKGLFAKLNDVFGNSDLSDAIRYYFYTGETKFFEENIKEATETYGQKEYSLYTEDEQAAFEAFTKNEAYELSGKTVFSADDYKGYRTYDGFRTKLGSWNEADTEAYEDYWKTSGLNYYNPPAETETGLAWWAWLLIALAIAVVVAAVAIVIVALVFSKKKKAAAEPVKRRAVDTTDNRDIDVYADDPTEPEVPEAPAEAAEEPAEEPSEELAENPEEE